ncbi:PHD finger-containing protein 1-like isoform X2 [Apium graveolens]|uniref:PHD finger-containing protein 1-like isoform X2 n=1 Tax=Apium graveolens TaxID=4045 RepID=UPI003D7990B0
MPELQTVCQTCGDKGIPEAIVICVKCHDAGEHRYCSPEWPKNFEDGVDWICSDCVLHNAEQSVSGNPFCRHPNSESLQPFKVHPEADLVKGSPLVKEKRTSCLNTNFVGLQKCVHEEMPSSKEEYWVGVKVSNDATSQARTDDTSTTLEAYDILQAQPFSDPTWRGGFSICSDNFCTEMGLASHLSTKASIKVYKAVQQFPSVLHLDIYPRIRIWPKSFSRSELNDEQIGIYLLPETESDECLYKSLLDRMVDEDLALMAVIDNSELLVFTSLQLPKESWRLMGNYYLWGVFKKGSPLQPNGPPP